MIKVNQLAAQASMPLPFDKEPTQLAGYFFLKAFYHSMELQKFGMSFQCAHVAACISALGGMLASPRNTVCAETHRRLIALWH